MLMSEAFAELQQPETDEFPNNEIIIVGVETLPLYGSIFWRRPTSFQVGTSSQLTPKRFRGGSVIPSIVSVARRSFDVNVVPSRGTARILDTSFQNTIEAGHRFLQGRVWPCRVVRRHDHFTAGVRQFRYAEVLPRSLACELPDSDTHCLGVNASFAEGCPDMADPSCIKWLMPESPRTQILRAERPSNRFASKCGDAELYTGPLSDSVEDICCFTPRRSSPLHCWKDSSAERVLDALSHLAPGSFIDTSLVGVFDCEALKGFFKRVH